MSKTPYFHIVDTNGKFLTKASATSDFTFTDNPHLAYTYDEWMANQLAKQLSPYFEASPLKAVPMVKN